MASAATSPLKIPKVPFKVLGGWWLPLAHQWQLGTWQGHADVSRRLRADDARRSSSLCVQHTWPQRPPPPLKSPKSLSKFWGGGGFLWPTSGNSGRGRGMQMSPGDCELTTPGEAVLATPGKTVLGDGSIGPWGCSWPLWPWLWRDWHSSQQLRLGWFLPCSPQQPLHSQPASRLVPSSSEGSSSSFSSPPGGGDRGGSCSSPPSSGPSNSNSFDSVLGRGAPGHEDGSGSSTSPGGDMEASLGGVLLASQGGVMEASLGGDVEASPDDGELASSGDGNGGSAALGGAGVAALGVAGSAALGVAPARWNLGVFPPAVILLPTPGAPGEEVL
ncbi:UNVERIFIED_CONTAM: hypothetical protein FKN15_051988 [Acipenser sinensis]